MSFTVQQSFNKAINYDKHAFLQQEIAKRLLDRFKLTKKNGITIDLGCGTGLLTEQLLSLNPLKKIIGIDIAKSLILINQQKHPNCTFVCADSHHLPIKTNSVDIVISNLMLQWCEQPKQIFNQAQRILKNNGLFLFSSFGVDTLYELKKSWQMVNQNHHINEFIDMHTLGDELIQSGFFDPVMEMEHITLTYQTVKDIMKDLKGIGANYTKKAHHGLTGKHQFQQMLNHYETFRKDGKLPATYEVIYGHAWCVKTQQKIKIEQI